MRIKSSSNISMMTHKIGKAVGDPLTVRKMIQNIKLVIQDLDKLADEEKVA